MYLSLPLKCLFSVFYLDFMTYTGQILFHSIKTVVHYKSFNFKFKFKLNSLLNSLNFLMYSNLTDPLKYSGDRTYLSKAQMISYFKLCYT